MSYLKKMLVVDIFMR